MGTSTVVQSSVSCCSNIHISRVYQKNIFSQNIHTIIVLWNKTSIKMVLPILAHHPTVICTVTEVGKACTGPEYMRSYKFRNFSFVIKYIHDFECWLLFSKCITKEKISGKAGLTMLLHLVMKVGKLLQPTVVYIGNAEKTFVKKVPKNDMSDPKRLKKELPKIIKKLSPEDRILFVGTSLTPWDILLKLPLRPLAYFEGVKEFFLQQWPNFVRKSCTEIVARFASNIIRAFTVS